MGDAAAGTWSRGQRVMHWWGASLVAVVLVLGWWMQRIPDDLLVLKYLAFQAHKLLGFVVLATTLWRLGLRARHARPPLADYPAWQRNAAIAAHRLLYVLLLAVPVLGYLTAITASVTVPVLPFVPLPAPLSPNPASFALFATAHWLGALALGLLAAGHATAALFDHLAGRTTLRAMWRG